MANMKQELRLTEGRHVANNMVNKHTLSLIRNWAERELKREHDPDRRRDLEGIARELQTQIVENY